MKNKEIICDICEQPINGYKSLTGRLTNRYKVKIKRIEEGYSMAGSYVDKRKLDVCPSCMKKFVEFVNSEVAE